MFLYQPTSGYCYNSDSIFLYNFISSFNPKGSLLDVGCGVGIISLLLSRDFNIETTIIDKQEKMLNYAQHNYALNNLEVKSHLGDFAQFETAEKFDYIISNPPFYDSSVTQSENTHLNIARYAHHLPIEDLIAKVKKLLKPRGYFIFCYDAQQFGLLCAALDNAKLRVVDVQFVHSKRDRKASIVLVHARKNSRSLMKVWPPFFAFEGNEYSKEAAAIYSKARTHTLRCQI